MRLYLFVGSILLLLICNIVSAQAIIAVKNDYKTDEIEQQVAYYAHALGFNSDVYILVNFSHRMPRSLGGFTRYQDSRPSGGGHQVNITISKKTGYSHQMRTLAHEMVHAQQLIEGRLLQCGLKHFRWEDQPCEKIDQIAYHDRPWEKEAVELSALLLDGYRNETAWLTLPK